MNKKALIIIQSRMSSSRLPGKAMLDVHGIPAALLCARRVGNTGLPVVVATSDDTSDDPLAEMMEKNGIKVVRGPLDDVLARFCIAAGDVADDTILFRLTADNMFPDGAFLEECLEKFYAMPADYASTMPQDHDRLPYGLVAELFSARLLREAQEKASSAFYREHVTPYMRSGKNRIEYIFFDPGDDYGAYRCTMDTLEDYLRILEIFKGCDSEKVSWRELCQALKKFEQETAQRIQHIKKHTRAISRMSLGTVQLGLAYGISNRKGQPDESESNAILETALQKGVTVFDTAAAYGESEQRVGKFFNKHKSQDAVPVTKLSPLTDLPDNADENTIKAFVEQSVFRSCTLLGRDRLDYLLLHRWEHYAAYDGLIWKALLDLQAAGCIDWLGASVYNPDQGMAALREEKIAFIQIPFNLADSRWKKAGFDAARQKRLDVIVQARSIYLQGLLVNKPKYYPVIPGFDPKTLPEQIDSFVEKFSRKSRQDLCCSYARSQSWIDTLVIGCETVDRVADNASLFDEPLLNEAQCADIEKAFMDVPEMLLDPSQWKT